MNSCASPFILPAAHSRYSRRPSAKRDSAIPALARRFPLRYCGSGGPSSYFTRNSIHFGVVGGTTKRQSRQTSKSVERSTAASVNRPRSSPPMALGDFYRILPIEHNKGAPSRRAKTTPCLPVAAALLSHRRVAGIEALIVALRQAKRRQYVCCALAPAADSRAASAIRCDASQYSRRNALPPASSTYHPRRPHRRPLWPSKTGDFYDCPRRRQKNHRRTLRLLQAMTTRLPSQPGYGFRHRPRLRQRHQPHQSWPNPPRQPPCA